ncbi:MAG: hypothetical protein IJU73_05975, partial [Ruminococcus sp.]|nr:hypothetical protein [Ruminococcus sp.]
MNNKKNSDTKELDSILAEIRGRNSASTAGTRRASSESKPKSSISRKNVEYLDADESLKDSYVFTDEGYTEIVPTQKKSAKKKAQAQPEYQPKKKKGKGGLIAAACIIGVLAIAAIAGVTIYLNSGSGTGTESTFSDNVFVNGIPLMDMTMEDARKAMSKVEQDLAGGIKITVKAGDKTFDYGKDAFKYTFNTDEILSQAKAYSEEKGIKTEPQEYE